MTHSVAFSSFVAFVFLSISFSCFAQIDSWYLAFNGPSSHVVNNLPAGVYMLEVQGTFCGGSCGGGHTQDAAYSLQTQAPWGGRSFTVNEYCPQGWEGSGSCDFLRPDPDEFSEDHKYFYFINHNGGNMTVYGLADECCWGDNQGGLTFTLNEMVVQGCTNPESCNFDADATVDDGSCIPSGCMDSDACNFNPEASCEGEECVYTCCPGPGCCDAGMHWDAELGMCQITNPADVNVDGCVQLSDLLGILSTYGICNDGSSWSCGQDLEYNGYEYGTLQIGGQCWFQENLKTRHYGNGDVIPIIYEDSLWAQASAGASCWLGNDSVIHHHNGRGMFYNHYAVTDERELCPSGWHVPTYHEFETLFEAVGGADIAGDALRSTLTDTECWGINAGWYDDEVTDPTDAFEFGMLATSGRSLQGGWDHPCNWGYTGWLWTTSVSYPYSPWFVYFHNDHQHVQLVKEWYGEGPERGLPVRCLKD